MAQPITGNKLYQKRARAALPLLVRQAKAVTPIFYSDLAAELGMPNPRTLNYVLGSIGQSLKQLSKSWKEKVPAIQCLVINKSTGLPGEGIGRFLVKRQDFAALSKQQQKAIINTTMQDIFFYPRWADVLDSFSLNPTRTNFTPLVSKASIKSGRGKGESKYHKALKDYVEQHPEIIGLKYGAPAGEKEFNLPSGDSLDVSFRHKKSWIAVEVKSRLSAEDDIVRGLYQCIKYQAVIEAVLKSEALTQNVRVVLVLETSLPQQLIGLKNILGIEVIEFVTPQTL